MQFQLVQADTNFCRTISAFHRDNNFTNVYEALAPVVIVQLCGHTIVGEIDFLQYCAHDRGSSKFSGHVIAPVHSGRKLNVSHMR